MMKHLVIISLATIGTVLSVCHDIKYVKYSDSECTNTMDGDETILSSIEKNQCHALTAAQQEYAT